MVHHVIKIIMSHIGISSSPIDQHDETNEIIKKILIKQS
jgi:hypothetical protein